MDFPTMLLGDRDTASQKMLSVSSMQISAPWNLLAYGTCSLKCAACDSEGDHGNSLAHCDRGTKPGSSLHGSLLGTQRWGSPSLLRFRAKAQQRRIKNLGKSEWWLGNMPLLTSSEIPTGSLIRKIHFTNFEIFKITFFFFLECVLFTIKWNWERLIWDSAENFCQFNADNK